MFILSQATKAKDRYFGGQLNCGHINCLCLIWDNTAQSESTHLTREYTVFIVKCTKYMSVLTEVPGNLRHSHYL